MRIVLFFIVYFFYHINAQWEILENSPAANGRHDDLYFINDNTGWVVNLDGKIYKTASGGENWFKQFDDDTYQFRSVGFVDEFRGWAGTLDGSLMLETFDGGISWSQVANLPDTLAGICGIAIVGDSVIYASGWYNGPQAYILKSTDQGTTWSYIDMRTHASSLIDIHFFDKDTGFVVGGSVGALGLSSKFAVVLQTTNGGQTWSTKHQTNRISEWGWKLAFPSRKVGFVSIESFNPDFEAGHILKTIDGGENWVEYPVNFKRVQGIGFADEQNGWLSGWGTGSRASFDGGMNWQSFTLGEHLNKFRFPSDSIGYAVGQRVYKYIRSKGPSEPPKLQPTLTVLKQNEPNPFNNMTTIRYSLKDPALVELTIYDVMGRKVKNLVKGSQDLGDYIYQFDASKLASGTYFCSILINQNSQTIKMIKLR